MQTVSGGRRKAEECNRMAICQKRPRMAAASGTQGGDGRKYAILAALRQDSMTGIRPFRRHPDRRKPAPCGRHPPARQPSRLTGDNPSLAFRAPPRPVWKRKTARSPFFPASHTQENRFAARNFRLCGKKEISFSKEIPFLPHKKTGRGGEMLVYCISPPRFPPIFNISRPDGPVPRIGRYSKFLLTLSF